MRAEFVHAIDVAGSAVAGLGVAVIVIGMLVATWRFLRPPWSSPDERYTTYRHSIGRSILLGLEFLVAADIIETVAVAPSLDSVIVLGGIVLIRTFLSLSLQVELEGRWPWRPRREP